MPQMVELFDAIVAPCLEGKARVCIHIYVTTRSRLAHESHRRAALARPETDNLESKSWFMTNRSVAAGGVGFGTP